MSFVWGLIGFMVLGFLGILYYRNGPLRRRRSVDALILRFDIPVNDRVIGLIDRRFHEENVGICLGGLLGLGLYSVGILLNAGQVPFGATGYPLPALLLAMMALGGAVAAVRQFAPAPGDAVRVARAQTPRLGDYVHPAWVWAAIGLTAVALLGSLTAALGIGADAAPHPGPAIPLAAVVGLSAVSTLALLVVALLSRTLLARPQPAGNEVELRWDDALRGTALHSLWLCPLALGLAASVVALDWLLPYSTATHGVLTFSGIVPIALFGFRLSRRSERRLWPLAAGNSELHDPVPYGS